MRRPKSTKVSGAPSGASKPRRGKEPQISFGATGRIDYGIDKPKPKKPGKRK